MQQNIILGINKLPQILNESGSKKLFIVTGSRSYQSLNFRDMIKSLDIERVYFTKFTSNPLYEEINESNFSSQRLAMVFWLLEVAVRWMLQNV